MVCCGYIILETLGKILSLIVVTMLGAGTVAVHILGPENKITINADTQSSYMGEPDSEVQSYREKMRHDMAFVEVEKPKDVLKKQHSSLWSETFITDELIMESKFRPVIIDLYKNSSVKELNSEMEHWHKRYQYLIRKPHKDEEAKHAYNKYRVYKEALLIKRAYN